MNSVRHRTRTDGTGDLIDPYSGAGDSYIDTMMTPRKWREKIKTTSTKVIQRPDSSARKKLTEYVKEYDEYEFGMEARDLFIRANEALRDHDDETLRQLTTPYAYKVHARTHTRTHYCAGDARRRST